MSLKIQKIIVHFFVYSFAYTSIKNLYTVFGVYIQLRTKFVFRGTKNFHFCIHPNLHDIVYLSVLESLFATPRFET
jgi:hypothetical protein